MGDWWRSDSPVQLSTVSGACMRVQLIGRVGLAIVALVCVGMAVPITITARMPSVQPSRDQRTAWVEELGDDAETGRMSGRFDAFWESGSFDVVVDGPSNVSLRSAVEWAREYATVVYVQIDGKYYSAGERHPDGSIPRMPASGLTVMPRPEGTPTDGTEQTRVWRVVSRVVLKSGVGGEAVDALSAEVTADSRVAEVTCERVDARELRVRLDIVGRSASAAVLVADDLVARALAKSGLPGSVIGTEYQSW